MRTNALDDCEMLMKYTKDEEIGSVISTLNMQGTSAPHCMNCEDHKESAGNRPLLLPCTILVYMW